MNVKKIKEVVSKNTAHLTTNTGIQECLNDNLKDVYISYIPWAFRINYKHMYNFDLMCLYTNRQNYRLANKGEKCDQPPGKSVNAARKEYYVGSSLVGTGIYLVI